MANVYPPSPALSACDSLADIEDLDAYLEAQGKLSHWPTPPTTDKKPDQADGDEDSNSLSVDSTADADDELWRIASAFANIASGRTESSFFDLELVLKALLYASVSPEILALAYNILSTVAPPAEERVEGRSFPIPDLAVTACLMLATTFIEDKAPDSRYWAQEVSKGFWPASQIDTTVLEFLTQPELKMLALSSPPAIDSALRELCDIANTPMDQFDKEDMQECMEDMQACLKDAPEVMVVEISEMAQWVNGALTPTETPTVESGSFLRLL